MKFLTAEEHKQVVERLISLLSSQEGIHHHEAGWVYTSLMVCFAMHSRGAAESILALHRRFGDSWFLATTGYVIARSLFEIDVTAHYIALEPVARSSRYIEYEHVIWKKRLEAIKRHRSSEKPSWREAMQLSYEHEFAGRESEIEANYDRVRSLFEDRKGHQARSWSGKSLIEMAREVDIRRHMMSSTQTFLRLLMST